MRSVREGIQDESEGSRVIDEKSPGWAQPSHGARSATSRHGQVGDEWEKVSAGISPGHLAVSCPVRRLRSRVSAVSSGSWTSMAALRDSGRPLAEHRRRVRIDRDIHVPERHSTSTLYVGGTSYQLP